MTLVAFDFDGTLSESEMTVLLGATRGVADDMAAITERAMNDELEYADSLRRRVALLEDLSLSAVETALGKVALRPGAADLVADLRDGGHAVAVVTGGFERGVAEALDRAGVEADAVVANRLATTDGKLTGEVGGPLVEGTKDDALADLADDHGVALAETVAVGDGANDLPMLEVAGLGVGFDPRPAVDRRADRTVATMGDLRGLLADEDLL